MTTTKRITSPDTARAMLAGIDYVLLDVDGVLVSGSTVLAGVPQALANLRRMGKKLRIVTNNSTRTLPQVVKHFADLKIPFAEEEIISSAAATANYLKHIAPSKPLEKGNVFVVGSPGLVTELQAVMPADKFIYGLEIHPETKHPFGEVIRNTNLNVVASAMHERILPPSTAKAAQGTQVQENESIDSLNIRSVIVGLDPSFTLTKLALANLMLRHRPGECEFIATNSDPQFSINYKEPGMTRADATALLPGGGTLVAAISTAVGRTPDVEVGKPYRYMFDLIAAREAREGESAEQFASRCLMIGDRLTTDVAFGKGVGTRTLFVLTGCEDEGNIERTGIVPDFVAGGLGVLGEMVGKLLSPSKL